MEQIIVLKYMLWRHADGLMISWISSDRRQCGFCTPGMTDWTQRFVWGILNAAPRLPSELVFFYLFIYPFIRLKIHARIIIIIIILLLQIILMLDSLQLLILFVMT
jgi:hypothetical protein